MERTIKAENKIGVISQEFMESRAVLPSCFGEHPGQDFQSRY